jgi:short-subunit dehydrogenase/aryl carrier-like protein
LLTAERMVAKGARNLLLIARSNPNDEARRRISAMQQAGVRIEVRGGDISNRTDAATILRETAHSMPPLRGIFHAAGIVDDGVVAQQSWPRFEKVMAPKVLGAWNLHELTQSKPLDFFVLFSSVASLTGSPGQASYSAGNAFLDALAHQRRTMGLPALSINWGAWANSGMAARVEAQGRRRALDVIRPMSPENCFAALQAAAEQGDAQLSIVDADWPRWKNPPQMIASLAKRGSTSAVLAPVNDILHRLEAAPYASRRGILLDFLREEALRVLGLSATHFIDEKQPLIKMGLDSLMAVEFRNRLTATLKRPLTATLLFDYPTLGQLANHLGAHDASQMEREADPLMAELGELTDEQAEELLREELRHS